MQIIDPHLHLFDLAKGDYHWLKPENQPAWHDKHLICNDFNEQDLTLNSPFELSGFVHIEAGFDNQRPWREIQWLEKSVSTPFKSIATVDLTVESLEFSKLVNKLSTFNSVVGVRHILDDEAFNILTHKNTLTNLLLLAHSGLHFELQMPLANQKAIRHLTALLQQCPKLRVVINHCGWPALAPTWQKSNNENWLAGLTLLAAFPQITIKCSGWEMMHRDYQQGDIKAVIQQVIAAFSIERVMLASNFPLTLFNQSYQSLWQLYKSKLVFNHGGLEALCYGNAKRIYRF